VLKKLMAPTSTGSAALRQGKYGSRLPDLPRRGHGAGQQRRGLDPQRWQDLFRQRGCVGCHRYEGYDKEPETCSPSRSRSSKSRREKDNFKQANDLMKQADTAESNDEANRLNDRAIALKVTNSKLDLRVVQLDRSTKSLLQDMKKVGPNLKDARLKLNKNWIPVWLKKPQRLPRHNQNAEFPAQRRTDPGHLRLHLAVRANGFIAQAQTG